MTDVIWRPDSATVERANVTRLMRAHGLADYRGFVRRATAEPDWYWPAVIDDLAIPFARRWDTVLDDSDGPAWARWFVGGKLNVATACVHRWATGPRASAVAVVWLGEDGARRTITFAELSREVTRLAEALVRLGVERGDRVALYLPMSIETVIASHACAHVGAIQTPIFSGFAAPAVAARLQDAEAKVLITADGSLRRGKAHPMKEIADEAAAHAPTLERMIVWRRFGAAGHCPLTPGRDLDWDEALAPSPGLLPAAELDSETPYLLTYTSGTTGKPKGVVHVHGGFLVSVAREVAYSADVGPADILHFVTDLGWIMGPWTVVGGGAVGCTLLLAEGAPDWPHDRLWQLVEAERVTVLGLSPTLVRALTAYGEPTADLSSLRVFISTGEPWNPEPYRWLAEHAGGGRVPIINLSGGTEVGAGFLCCSVVEPIKVCSLGGPVPGMDMDVLDPEGRSLIGTGEVGELVCRRPSPGMTRGFWNDPERYLDAYWRRYPDVWTHGDWATVDADGHWFLHGRSDDTLNIAGKRIGPAEIESAAVGHPAVREAAAVGVPHALKGEVAWVFCALSPGYEGSDALAGEVFGLVADAFGKPFAPERVVFVEALPKTRSAKIVRRAVRAAALGLDPGDLSSVENPEAITEIARLVQ